MKNDKFHISQKAPLNNRYADNCLLNQPVDNVCYDEDYDPEEEAYDRHLLYVRLHDKFFDKYDTCVFWNKDSTKNLIVYSEHFETLAYTLPSTDNHPKHYASYFEDTINCLKSEASLACISAYPLNQLVKISFLTLSHKIAELPYSPVTNETYRNIQTCLEHLDNLRFFYGRNIKDKVSNANLMDIANRLSLLIEECENGASFDTETLSFTDIVNHTIDYFTTELHRMYRKEFRNWWLDNREYEYIAKIFVKLTPHIISSAIQSLDEFKMPKKAEGASYKELLIAKTSFLLRYELLDFASELINFQKHVELYSKLSTPGDISFETKQELLDFLTREVPQDSDFSSKLSARMDYWETIEKLNNYLKNSKENFE